MSYKLFLDDYRIPKKVFYYTNDPVYLKDDWVVVKTYDEFIEKIIEDGIPDLVSFDHDLSSDHYQHFEEGDVIPYDEYKDKTGYHCAKWLIHHCVLNELKLPKAVYIHSMNVVGSENIKSLFEAYYNINKRSLFNTHYKITKKK